MECKAGAIDQDRESGSTRRTSARRSGWPPDVAGGSHERRRRLGRDDRARNIDRGRQERRREGDREAEVALFHRVLTGSRVIVAGVIMPGIARGLPAMIIVVMMTVIVTVMMVMSMGDREDRRRRGRMTGHMTGTVSQPEVQRPTEGDRQHHDGSDESMPEAATLADRPADPTHTTPPGSCPGGRESVVL
jgi:hypothetical protein